MGRASATIWEVGFSMSWSNLQTEQSGLGIRSHGCTYLLVDTQQAESILALTSIRLCTQTVSVLCDVDFAVDFASWSKVVAIDSGTN